MSDPQKPKTKPIKELIKDTPLINSAYLASTLEKEKPRDISWASCTRFLWSVPLMNKDKMREKMATMATVMFLIKS